MAAVTWRGVDEQMMIIAASPHKTFQQRQALLLYFMYRRLASVPRAWVDMSNTLDLTIFTNKEFKYFFRVHSLSHFRRLAINLNVRPWYGREHRTKHKRHNGLKLQAISLPNGMIGALFGPAPGRWHDARIYSASHVTDKLEHLSSSLKVLGDAAYARNTS
ncbi:hypothetical protein PTSG_07972 [Salpingoeca rosetta]|uniref:DDE Tnp4 domain-containing protein n=1 Tax=Salpingoeca rosetta (strain ATCC 50818 / BSB-021) TaxID=946362 RepID=F2UGV6_SALR5|nr:uncharacterized protein PTSG_07972 [Salpingoeca rosetta]EGD75856.1 hypothetical protein PTSG_07972 [Salpingoeca rosetta]|eukprot:XP_004991777.1 hypothetical protein PTSG_07972 [Salpingoeca rosetta]